MWSIGYLLTKKHFNIRINAWQIVCLCFQNTWMFDKFFHSASFFWTCLKMVWILFMLHNYAVFQSHQNEFCDAINCVRWLLMQICRHNIITVSSISWQFMSTWLMLTISIPLENCKRCIKSLFRFVCKIFANWYLVVEWKEGKNKQKCHTKIQKKNFV